MSDTWPFKEDSIINWPSEENELIETARTYRCPICRRSSWSSRTARWEVNCCFRCDSSGLLCFGRCCPSASQSDREDAWSSVEDRWACSGTRLCSRHFHRPTNSTEKFQREYLWSETTSLLLMTFGLIVKLKTITFTEQLMIIWE